MAAATACSDCCSPVKKPFPFEFGGSGDFGEEDLGGATLLLPAADNEGGVGLGDAAGLRFPVAADELPRP